MGHGLNRGCGPSCHFSKGTAELQTLWGPSLLYMGRWGTVWDVLCSGLQGKEVVAAARCAAREQLCCEGELQALGGDELCVASFSF